MKIRTLALAVLFVLPAGLALADGVVQKLMTSADKTRLEKYDETRKVALAEAKGSDGAELAQLDALLAKPLLSLPDFDLGGEWRCRTTKVGGLSPLVVYGWFKCRVRTTARAGSSKRQAARSARPAASMMTARRG